jgi:hypothetical protein
MCVENSKKMEIHPPLNKGSRLKLAGGGKIKKKEFAPAARVVVFFSSRLAPPCHPFFSSG